MHAAPPCTLDPCTHLHARHAHATQIFLCPVGSSDSQIGVYNPQLLGLLSLNIKRSQGQCEGRSSEMAKLECRADE
jgi:hypothetical protein